jgi:hypothetical protein
MRNIFKTKRVELKRRLVELCCGEFHNLCCMEFEVPMAASIKINKVFCDVRPSCLGTCTIIS